ncbi:MAG: hypothetical protein HY813_01435 [Candidatus Portnoybacteria bacterium]|nr:hypothetical protein [Candidatus Portnoybacteria bacterium]
MNDLKEFIRKRKYLFWYIKDPVNLSEESVVEHILNYGDWEDAQTMIKIMGIKKVAKIFRKKSKKSKMGRCNYRPEVIHYFTLYFNKYA